MTLKFKTVQRKHPGNSNAPVKYYAQAVSRGKVTMVTLAERLSQDSAYSTQDILFLLKGFLSNITGELANGNIVKLGDFGSFNITLSSEGTNAPEQFTKSHIMKNYIRFRPGRLLQNKIDNAGYKSE